MCLSFLHINKMNKGLTCASPGGVFEIRRQGGHSTPFDSVHLSWNYVDKQPEHSASSMCTRGGHQRIPPPICLSLRIKCGTATTGSQNDSTSQTEGSQETNQPARRLFKHQPNPVNHKVTLLVFLENGQNFNRLQLRMVIQWRAPNRISSGDDRAKALWELLRIIELELNLSLCKRNYTMKKEEEEY